MDNLIQSFASKYKMTIGILFTLCFMLGGNLYAQQVTGVVTDSTTQEPLPGVNVVVKGTTTGTSTNADGDIHLLEKDVASILDDYINGVTAKLYAKYNFNFKMISQAT